MTAAEPGGATTPEDDDLLADLFDSLLQDILEGRTPDLDALHPDRPDLRERIRRTWQLACSVAGRREPSRPVLGGYEIVRELGHGGMGTVYLARHQTLQRDVAIKVLPHSLAMSPRAKQRFLEEAKSLARIRHDHVVHIHRIIDHAEMLAFEMEYVDGPSLQALVQTLRQDPRPWTVASLQRALGQPLDGDVRSGVEWIVRLGIRVARALAEVHRHGLIHRDVKPSNILLRRDGTPVLADFGLALADDPEATRTNFAGTPVYAAPERLRGGDRHVDARTDVYSLGVTLYEALTTSPPFAGSSTHEVLRRIENGATPPLRQRAPHVPRDLAVVIHKAMEPDPRHRYADADAFADDLERLLSLQPIHARPAGPLRRAWQFVRRHHTVVAAAVAGALLVAAIAWPLAAHAASQREAGERAAAAVHRARSRLLAPDSLPTAWTVPTLAGVVSRNSAAEAARRAAFAASLAAYDEALQATPLDDRLRSERAAVAAAARACGGDAPAAPHEAGGALLARLTANATAHRRLDDGLTEALAAASAADRLAGGLFAFLWGDANACARCWDPLPSGLRDDPLLDACGALQLAAQGASERAYPRLFHAARAFPAADAIALALADAALASGDTELARLWLDRLQPVADVLADARRRRLAADLLAVGGDRAGAARQYRELAQLDPTDPTPLLRLATLQLQDGDRARGKRLLQSLSARWPGLAAAHTHLARLALQEHDVPAYLAHLRQVAAGMRRDGGPAAASLAATLRLGGLQRLAGELAPDVTVPDLVARDADAIPLRAWLSAARVAGIEQAVRTFAVFDAADERCAAADPRPVGALLRSVWLTAWQLPELTLRLPHPLPAALLGGLPLSFGTAADVIGLHLAPYARALGVRMHTTHDRVMFRRELDEPDVVFGATVLRTDLDGDTLPELCFAAPPMARSPDNGFVEIRDLADGGVLRTWQPSDGNAMFARAIATVGDADGDLCDDLALGVPLRRDGPGAVAAVELWSGRRGERVWRREDDLATWGAAIAAIGDLDGDRVSELLVGRPPLSLDDGPTGSAVVLSGRTGAVLRTLVAERDDVWFGGAVAAAGDASGDGRPDLLVGGNFARAPGLVTVFDGGTGAMLASYTDANPDSEFGHSVLGVGDLDGDGRSDVVVAAPARNGRGGDAGRVLVFGSRTGKAIYELRGERAREGFGNVIACLPDWRRDGRPALVVGTVAGGPHGTGYLRVYDLATGAPLQTFAGNPGHAHFGYSVGDLGDRDGDGLRDLAVLSVLRDRTVLCYALSFADAYPTPGDVGRRR